MEMVSGTSGQSFLAGRMIGSGRKSPARDKRPLWTVALSLESQRTTEPTIFPFQPRAFSELVEPGPGPFVVRDCNWFFVKTSPVANPRPRRVVCFVLGIIDW